MSIRVKYEDYSSRWKSRNNRKNDKRSRDCNYKDLRKESPNKRNYSESKDKRTKKDSSKN
jgi:hypothetical protein